MFPSMAAVQSISLVLLLLAVLPMGAGCSAPPRVKTEESPPVTSPVSFALYTLSRGRGVPAPTRGVYRDVRDMLERGQDNGTVIRLEETRFGLEGETRLCAELRMTRTGYELLQKIRTMTDGVELLRFVEEPLLEP